MSQRYLGGIITANPTAPTLTSASGVWTTEQQFQNIANWPKSTGLVSRSVRLRSSASAYFNRTPSLAGNRKIWTWSGWVKRGTLGALSYFFSANTNAATDNDHTDIRFTASDTLQLANDTGGAVTVNLNTTQVFRDPSAWYHIVVSVDTTQATSSNRIKLYVNGTQITAFGTATYPSQNADLFINNSINHRLGSYQPAANYFDGYLTEINFIDGQALTPSYFGFTDGNGVWQPATYSGTYGTNGFYLNFSDNSGVTATTIGKDYSGNSNNWTPNNISVTAGTTYDSMLDSPTPYADGGNGRGNYAVVNPLSLASSTTLSEANLKGVSSTFNNLQSGTVAVSSGKWYWELTFGGSLGMVGIVPASAPPTTDLGYTATSYGYRSSTGTKYNNGSATAYGNTYTTNDVIGVALDLDNGKLFFSKNNTWQNSGDPAAGTNAAFTGLSGSFMPAAGTPDTTAATWYWNFGQRPFSYTPPTGFVALNTQNLPTPTISNGAQYMAATLYTGTGSAMSVSNAVNNVSFQPDWVWIKQRNSIANHVLADAIRGVDKYVFSNLTNAEATATAGTGITAFNSNGFSLGTETSTVGSVNAAGGTGTYVAWQWNAGGSTVTNTSGTISSQVRANATAGFSVVTYTGNGTSGATVGHGLGVAPAMMIIKLRNSTENWPVYHKNQNASPANGCTYLSLTNAYAAFTGIFNNTVPTSSVFTLGNNAQTNGNTNTYVAYCFAEVAGYSAFGSYTGNGSAAGPFVYTGFRPRFVMTKRTDSTGGWVMLDSARDSYNVSGNILQAESSAAELAVASYPTLDILSNGFKIRSSTIQNASGGTYIFMAVAENPFKLSRAR